MDFQCEADDLSIDTVILLASTFLLSLATALAITPRVRESALRFGVLDAPTGTLKKHKTPVAYLGGIAVYISFLVPLSLTFELRRELLGLLLGGTIVVMLGLFDDLKAISPKLKLTGQLLAAWVTLRSGIVIELVAIPEWASVPLSVLWILGFSNAFNILDVSDGLSTSVAGISALGFSAIAMLNGDAVIASAGLALAGACLGFLRFNRAPASIYLGDAGSLFLGFLLGCLALIGSYSATTTLGIVAPLLILFVPLLETALVSVARIARGLSPMAGSDDHLAIRLKARGWSSTQVARRTQGLALCTAALGVAIVQAPVHSALAIIATGATGFLGLLLWLYFACPAPSARELFDLTRDDEPAPTSR